MATLPNPLVKIYADFIYYRNFKITEVPSHLRSLVTTLLATYPPDPYMDDHKHKLTDVTGLDTEIAKKVDKVDGKILSTNDYTTDEKTKLAGIAPSANNYVHPTNHPATIITQSPTHRFVTDTKIAEWDGKETVTGSQAKANAALSAAKLYADGLEPELSDYEKTMDVNSKDAATLISAKSYTDTKVAGIVDTAPEALDTLNELAAALGDDPNFATTVATQIGTKVDKVAGKGLSANDYTTIEKTKLSGIESGANNYQHPANHPASMITGLSTVATSGNYNDLTNKPTLNNTVTSTSTIQAATANAVKTAYDLASEKVSRSGDTMTGILTAQANTSYTVRQVHNMILSDQDANLATMQNGDIWIKYK